MRKAALLISAGVMFFAGAAFAQYAGAPNSQPAASPPSAATATQSPTPQAQPGGQAQTSAPASQQASDAACNADAQKFCAGKQAAERQQCLNDNKASLATACRATLGGPVRN